MKVFVLAGGELNGKWICDVLTHEWYQYNSAISTQDPEEADIIWLLAGWVWKKIPIDILKRKKVITTIHHIVEQKFDKGKQKIFKKRDKITDIYHVACQKTADFISGKYNNNPLTTKPVISIPFWINPNIWKPLNLKNNLRQKWRIPLNAYVIGSFQRDTEGKPLNKGKIVPKLEKGPDILCNILEDIRNIRKNNNKKQLCILLSGCRRDYVISNLRRMNIPYIYYEMVELQQLNELYNCLDLYIVSSRCEGGPRAILESGVSGIPIISSDVGIAPEFLPSESIFDWRNWKSYRNAKPNPLHVKDKVNKCVIPQYFNKFIEMINSLNSTILNIKIENWHLCKDAAFSSTWDDMTFTSLYDITNEANKRNIKTTIYINGENKEWNTDLFYGNNKSNNEPLIFNDEIKKRLKIIYDCGNELGNHTYSHYNLRDASLIDSIRELTKCNKLINSITNQNEFTFCFPHGHLAKNKQIMKYIRDNFIASRCADYPKNKLNALKFINTYSNINLQQLKTLHIGTYPYQKSIDELNYIIDETIKKDGWIIEYGHGWCPVNRNMLLNHYDYVSKQNIWCDTIINISKYIIQKKQITMNVAKIEEGYKLSFTNCNFKHKIVPMTISFNYPEKNYDNSRDNSRDNIKVFQENNKLKLNKYKNKIYFIINNYKTCVIKI